MWSFSRYRRKGGQGSKNWYVRGTPPYNTGGEKRGRSEGIVGGRDSRLEGVEKNCNWYELVGDREQGDERLVRKREA